MEPLPEPSASSSALVAPAARQRVPTPARAGRMSPTRLSPTRPKAGTRRTSRRGPPLGLPALLIALTFVSLPFVARAGGDGIGGLAAQQRSESGRSELAEARAEAEDELRLGRSWHAARALEPYLDEGILGREDRLLLARAQAGYRAWDRVIGTLEEGGGLDALAGGAGPGLLGRAYEARGRSLDAVAAYRLFLATTTPPHLGAVPEDAGGKVDAGARPAARMRLARLLVEVDSVGAALALLDEARREDGAGAIAASWLAAELARSRAERGDTAGVDDLLARVSDPDAEARLWEVRAEAILAAGDTTRAVRDYRELARRGASDDARLARAHFVAGELLLATKDTASAVEAYRAAFGARSYGASGVGAARRLIDLTEPDATLSRRLARSLQGAGDVARSLRAWDRYVEATPAGEIQPADQLARARLMATTAEHQADAVELFRALSRSPEVEIGSTALEAWADLRRRQGRGGDVATLRAWLIERYPSSPQAADVIFFRGDAAHDRGALDIALGEYDRLQQMAPDLNRAGLARMRAGMIRLQRGDSTGALETFRSYLDAYPNGRRWDEASYWAGAILLGFGRAEEGETLLRSIGRRDPFSYYAVLASEALAEPYALGIDEGSPIPTTPPWLASELKLVDLLAAVGLPEARSVRVDDMVERALDESTGVALALGHALIERGLTIEGINVGWALRERGEPWSRALARVVYPLPDRETLARAAEERGLDPVLVAAVIRQESAFDPDIESSAGALGLMQVMPATGRQLARTIGPADFDRGSLETPEINLHLGTWYLAELTERYDGTLPLVLSAYNAGPTRANRWRDFPEMSEPLHFVERIPFAETRDYVKKIRRNIAVYGALYRGLQAA